MITTLSLLPFAMSTLASATPITIADVNAAREGGRMVVDISADAMVDPEAASAKISDGHIYLFVGDTRVKADNRAWGEGADQIRAHRHKHQVELVVPIGDDGACSGPVEFVKAAGGLRATIGCESAMGRERETARAARPKARAAAGGATMLTASAGAAVDQPLQPSPSPSSSPARKPDPRDTRELKAVLGLDEPARREEPEAPAPKAVAHAALAGVSPAVVPAAAAPAAPPVLAAVPVETKPVVAAPTPVIPAAPITPAPAPAVALADPAPRGGAGVGIYLAGGLMALLAAGAYVFNRRRVAVPRLVTIVETASLGPKRSIVVARIGGETMILGTSEAGITVLQAHPGATAPAAIAAAAAAIADPEAPDPTSLAAVAGEIPDADVDIDEPMMPVQGGLLARLFRRGKPANESEFHNFEQLLEDSVEDQELRHKLSLGMAGRVP